MIAEKAALLGRENEEGDTEIPRLGSDNPTSPLDERNNPTLSITTPGEGHITDPLAGATNGMSEKARGKMRAVDPSSTQGQGEEGEGEMVDVPDEELMKVALAGVGTNSYIPTQEWVSSWQKG